GALGLPRRGNREILAGGSTQSESGRPLAGTARSGRRLRQLSGQPRLLSASSRDARSSIVLRFLDANASFTDFTSAGRPQSLSDMRRHGKTRWPAPSSYAALSQAAVAARAR